MDFLSEEGFSRIAFRICSEDVSKRTYQKDIDTMFRKNGLVCKIKKSYSDKCSQIHDFQKDEILKIS